MTGPDLRSWTGLEVTGTRRIAGEPSAGPLLLSQIVGLRLQLGVIAYPLAVLTTLLLPLDRDTSAVINLFGLRTLVGALPGVPRWPAARRPC